MCAQSAFLPPHLGLESFALCAQNQGPDFRLLVALVEELGPTVAMPWARCGESLSSAHKARGAADAAAAAWSQEALASGLWGVTSDGKAWR